MTKKEDARVRSLLQSATRPEKVVPIVLKADIAAQIEVLELELIELRKNDLESLAGNPEAAEIAGKIEALIEESKGSTVNVTIRGLPRKAWSDLKAKHPPADPRLFLYGPTFMDEAVPACWAGPELDAETRDKLLDALTGGQWDHLCMAVQNVNGDVEIPFSALATVARRTSVENEPQPAPTA